MIGSEPVVERAAPDAIGPTNGSFARVGTAIRKRPATSIFFACLLAAIISVLVLPWPPGSDPFAWITWGQELVNPKISVGFAGAPSWKPFPVFFTTIFALFGNTAPHLWLIVSRTGSALALVAVFRLGRRFGGVAAGILAVVALCFVQDWVFYLARGDSEPIVAALTLWAVDRHLNQMPRVAYALLFLAALNRPEFSPILFLYGVYLWLRMPDTRTRVYVVALLVLVPVAWLGPPGILVGEPLQAKNAAAGGSGSPGTAIAELRSSGALMTVPVLVLAGIGFVLACLRRNKILIWLGVGAIAWALMVALITQFFYGLPRYLLPAAVIGCVFAALAIVWIAEYVAARVGGMRGAGEAAASSRRGVAVAAAVVVGLALLAATLPWTITRGKLIVTEVNQADQAGAFERQLFTAVDRVGGQHVVLPCKTSVVAINHTMASTLAWKLQVRLARIRPLMATEGYVFAAPHTRDTGSTPPVPDAAQRLVRRVTTVGQWGVFTVSRPSGPGNRLCAPPG